MPGVGSLEMANALAARGTTAYLIGRGLAAEIDDARFPEDEDPISAPYLAELIAELGVTAGDACNAGDRVAQLLGDADASDAVSVVEPARLVLNTLRIFSPDSPAADVRARVTASTDDD